MEGIRGIATDVPQNGTGVDQCQSSFVLVMLDPAPDVVPLDGLLVLTPL